MSEPIIWGLFDSGNGCYKQAVNEYNTQNVGGQFRIISIGIDRENKSTDFLNQDLSVNTLYNEAALYGQLDELPTPDIILASPPCESWSVASSMRQGNACWKKEEHAMTSLFGKMKEPSKFTIRPHSDYECYQYKYDNQFRTRINGEMCIYNTIQIIKRYNPKIFVIENPAFGRIWEYIEDIIGFDLPYENLTYYSDYGFDYKKPTRFSSNIDLCLKQIGSKSTISWKNTRGYNMRSNIPIPLILDILKRCNETLRGNI